MTRTNRLHRTLATALLAVGLVAGACGGDAEDAEDAAEAPEATEATEAPAAGATAGDTVRIVDFNYSPDELQVEAGTTVTFTNEDGFAHTATAKDKSFDSGNLDEGDTFEHTFTEAGTYEYLCAIHNSMTGSVVVS